MKKIYQTFLLAVLLNSCGIYTKVDNKDENKLQQKEQEIEQREMNQEQIEGASPMNNSDSY